MRFFTARSLALATLVPALLLFVVVPGCAKQSEGERCGDDKLPNDEDCADGLTCTKNKDELLNNEAHRCCYPDGHFTDSRCEPKGAGSTTSTSGASGASNGGAGRAGGSSAGSSSEAASGASGEGS